MKHYIKLMRIHHYIKNFLVFAALACSGQLLNLEKLAVSTAGFAAFCLISSVVYIINDIRDVEKDRNHPAKCRRPIASGMVPVRNAWILAGVLLTVVAVISVLLPRPEAAVYLLAYLLMNLAYSFGLKNVPLLDVAILATGFLLRVLYGALLTAISVSQWLYLTVMAVAFYFGLGKRRNELKRLKEGDTRQVLRAYPLEFLDKAMSMCLTLTIVFYALWTMDKGTAQHYRTEYLSLTVPLVILITLKYSLNIEGDSDGDPVEVLLHDKVLLGLCAIYLTVMLMLLYT